jgi:hypothetical protein
MWFAKRFVKELIGGQVGNKGAVEISLEIANTTMLFVNAHLARKATPSECSLPKVPDGGT